jgi:hypothetical protein
VQLRPQAGLVLFIADLFHPINDLAVEIFLNGDVRHGCGRRCAMPMLQTRRKPDYITGPNLLDRTALTLNPAEARGDDQCLAERMRVPCRASAGFEGDLATAHPRRVWRLE